MKSEPNFLQQVITGDETWVFEYDPTTKRQSSEWHTSESPPPKKARMSKSRVKSMLIFFYSKGIVHKEFVPPGQTESNILPTDTRAFKAGYRLEHSGEPNSVM